MRALVHSGGGSKGSYACGALAYLLGDLQRDYQVFCGVSVGAINTAFLSQFPTGQEKVASDELIRIWSQIDTSKVYHDWRPFGKWAALWKTSLYDSSPLQHLIRENTDLTRIRNSGKQINVGAVSLNSGKYVIFDQSSDHLIEAVIASASFPGLLTPIPFDGHLWADGGIKQISPIKQAIDLGASEIDVIMTSPQTRIKHFIEHPKTIDIMKRALDLSSDKIMSNDIERMEMYNQLAEAGLTEKRQIRFNIIRPAFNLTDDLLDFDPVKMRKMMDLGYADAQKIGNS
jgi:NTE family protein